LFSQGSKDLINRRRRVFPRVVFAHRFTPDFPAACSPGGP
jgi:hypothetical protein